MRLFAIVVLFVLVVFGGPAVAQVATEERIETPAVAAAGSEDCREPTNSLESVVLEPWNGDLTRALGIPEPQPQHCDDCCTQEDWDNCRESCPPFSHCYPLCIDCNTHICVCQEV